MTASKTTIDAFTVDQLGDAVGLATNTCPVVWWEDAHAVGCAGCKDKGPKPGFVWALPGMQERCGCLAWVGKQVPSDVLVADGLQEYHRKANIFCHGTGWVAKRDLGALFISVIPLDEIYLSVVDAVSKLTIDQPIESVLRAVAQALVASGATLGVTADEA